MFCVKCEQEKSSEDFYVSNRASCKGCVKKKTKLWYREHLQRAKNTRQLYRKNDPEKTKTQRRVYYEKNKGHIQAKAKKWAEDNREQMLITKKKYHHANKENCNAKRRRWNVENREARREQQWKYKAQRRAALGDLPKGYIGDLWESQEGKCAYCPAFLIDTGFHLEHRTPLSRGGLHSIENVCLACPECNISKGSKTVEEFVSKSR